MSRKTVDQYFAVHPEEMDGVRRATYAYHLNHREPKAHYFAGAARDACCRWCGRTRERVRWDDSPPECPNRPGYMDQSIESVIAKEEKMFEKVMDRAAKLAAEINLETLTGEELATLHHTHGVDPSMLECALIERGLSLRQELHDAYQAAYEAHRDTGKRGQKKIVIVAK